MASRQDTAQRKRALEKHLRELCDRQAHTGGPLPPLRDLSDQFELSLKAAHGVLQTIQREGLVTSVRGSGTMVTPRPFRADQLFFLLRTEDASVEPQRVPDTTAAGFTARMAERGAFVIEMPDSATLVSVAEHSPIRCLGAYANSWDPLRHTRLFPPMPFPIVGFDEHADPETDDRAEFDDYDGGRVAAEHLLALGHRSIVFLGETERAGTWSANRAGGFREAMNAAGAASRGQVLAFPEEPHSNTGFQRFGEACGARLAADGLPDAVVGANDDVAVGFLRALHRAEVPLARWPAVVGFDDALSFGGQMMTSMRQDRIELGRTIADLLWERAHGRLVGPPAVRRVPMSLIGRLTSQPGWAFRLDQILGRYPIPGTEHPR